jgi:hypothetical protein
MYNIYKASVSTAGHALSLVAPATTAVCLDSTWVSFYITSGRTQRENTFQSRIHGNVCLSLSDGLFPKIYLHGNVFTEPLPSTGSMHHIIMTNVPAKSDAASRDLQKVGLHLEQ